MTGPSPKFKKPPVVETVLGVQFPEIQGFRAVHFGLYWNGTQGGVPGIRDRYPKAEDRPRLDPVRERFPRPLLTTPALQLGQRTLPDRVWFMAASDSELIQLQPDRFHYNWRQGEQAGYPSYERTSEAFFREFDAFCEFCLAMQLAAPEPEICEVTYVNHIHPGSGESLAELAHRVFCGLDWATNTGFLTVPESFAFNRAYTIHSDRKQVGRLYAEASVAARPGTQEPREFILLNLTARINLVGASQLKDSLQLAHDWVVHGFADLTEQAVQKERWGRVQ